MNGLLKSLGLIDNYLIWLADPDKTLILIANAAIWKQMPLAAILLLVTMKSIPEDLYKAARVDGANHLQRFLHVTLPSLRPGLMLVLVYETMISIRHFDLFMILTQGGPGNASATLSWQIYVETFRSLRFGSGSALAYILALATLDSRLSADPAAAPEGRMSSARPAARCCRPSRARCCCCS